MSAKCFKISVVAGLLIVLCAAMLATSQGRNLAWAAYTRLMGRATVGDRLAELGDAARTRMYARFNGINMRYPPARVALLAFKEERLLEVYVAERGATTKWQWLDGYEIRGLSGTTGPKLAEGDQQVPEGVYEIESLNPNSRFHLALRVNYPNKADRARAHADGRKNLGGDIMIHGGNQSIGCLAMGDQTIEDLFVLAADVGVENVEVLIAPRDLRFKDRQGLPTTPAWIAGLYDEIEMALARFPPLGARTPAGDAENKRSLE